VQVSRLSSPQTPSDGNTKKSPPRFWKDEDQAQEGETQAKPKEDPIEQEVQNSSTNVNNTEKKETPDSSCTVVVKSDTTENLNWDYVKKIDVKTANEVGNCVGNGEQSPSSVNNGDKSPNSVNTGDKSPNSVNNGDKSPNSVTSGPLVQSSSQEDSGVFEHSAVSADASSSENCDCLVSCFRISKIKVQRNSKNKVNQ